MWFHRATEVQPEPIRPYYGKAAWNATINQTLILSLANRGPTAGSRAATGINFPSGTDLGNYYAYPVAYGEATFIDVSNGLPGGWDGANRDPLTTWGPVIVHGVVAEGQPPQDFYVYQSDFPNLDFDPSTHDIGNTNWNVT